MLHKRTHFKQFAPQEDQILPAAKTKTMKTHHILIIALALLCGAKASAQEWKYTIENLGNESPNMYEAKPLRNGNIAVTYLTRFPYSTLGSLQPGLLLLSSDGVELARNSFAKPAFWGYNPHVLSDEDGTIYMMAVYNPDHDSTCANYFMNFDNPPDYSILGLYKLDEQLSVVESHEFQIPVDTSDVRSPGPNIFGSFNEYCGDILVISAFFDEGTVVGGYIKKPSLNYYNPPENDSIFFFRIGLDGTLLNHVGYELDKRNESGGGTLNWATGMHGYNVVKSGDSYVCFLNRFPISGYCKETKTDKNYYTGHAYFLDNGFNIVDLKHYNQKNGPENNYFSNATFIGSRHNTVYMSSDYNKGPSQGTGCSLYEYGLNNDKTGTLPILRYIGRTQSSYDYVGMTKGVSIASDNSIYFAYAFRDGMNGLTIEHLTPDFDTISTLFYTIENAEVSYALSVEITESDDILLTSKSGFFDPTILWWTTVTKFPAEAFVGIEEAHAHGLKVAVAYPNPGKGVLNIRTGLKNARVEVYDMGGRLMHSQPLKGSVTPINAEDWPSGVYVWKIYQTDPSALQKGSGTLVETGKWVKE